jgi:hypothetical protein
VVCKNKKLQGLTVRQRRDGCPELFDLAGVCVKRAVFCEPLLVLGADAVHVRAVVLEPRERGVHGALRARERLAQAVALAPRGGERVRKLLLFGALWESRERMYARVEQAADHGSDRGLLGSELLEEALELVALRLGA